MRILVFELPVKQPVTKGGSRIHVWLKEMKICVVIRDRTARPLTVQTDATTPNIVAPTMLRVSVVWKRMQQLLTKQHAITCNRLCKRTQRVTSNNVASVCTGPYLKCRYSKAPCKRTQHCWVHVASVCPPPLLHVVAFCCVKFETGQTFSYAQTDATIPSIIGTTIYASSALQSPS